MNFEQTSLWPRLLDLAGQCDAVANGLPRHEIYSTASQLRRAAGSVYANYAEGWGRRTRRDSLHFIVMARASLNEVKAHLLYAQSRGWTRPDATKPLFEEIDQIRRIFVTIAQRLSD